MTDTRAVDVGELCQIVGAAVDGGVTAVQLRAKGWTDRQALYAAQSLQSLCAERNVLFVVNDRVDIAVTANADGVHLGVDDLPVAAARAMLGPDAVIGFSPETDVQIQTAQRDGVSYLGVGPVFGTMTKPDAGPAIGLDRLRRVVEAFPVPVVGVGGIDATNATSVLDAGASGVAVVSAIMSASDPEAAARSIAGQVR